jgi:ABC-type lipoprotein release transport system permease subunit
MSLERSRPIDLLPPVGAGRLSAPLPRLRIGGLPYPIRTVVRRWRGMLGMILGVGIALGISMAMLGVNAAVMDLVTRGFRASGADLRVIARGGTLIPVLPGESQGTIKHAGNVLTQVRGLPGVREAVGVMNWELERERPGPRHADAPAELIAAMGIDGDPTRIPGAVTLEGGRWIRRSDEIVVGPKLSREKRIGVDDTLRLNGRDFRVVGVGRLRGFSYEEDAVAYLERRSLRQRALVGDVVNVVVVDTDRPDLAQVRIPDLDSLAVYDVEETVRLAEAAQAADRVILWAVALMTLAIAALFVRTMLAGSVETRRLEIATLRAIGVAGRTVLLTVAGEALVICVAAWAVGVGVSSLLGWLINAYMAPAYGEESFYAADATLFLTVFGLALGLGIVSGLGPALQATRVDPVEVLREA